MSPGHTPNIWGVTKSEEYAPRTKPESIRPRNINIELNGNINPELISDLPNFRNTLLRLENLGFNTLPFAADFEVNLEDLYERNIFQPLTMWGFDINSFSKKQSSRCNNFASFLVIGWAF